MNDFTVAVVVGVGATAVTDLWGIARKPLLGIAAPNFGLVGRWIAYMPRGQFKHDSIAAAAPVRGERLMGWTAHYLIGVVFAAVLIGLYGSEWIQRPTIAPALIVGVATLAAPFFLMQPGMGAGIAGARTPRPAATRLQSVVMHAVFGLGLYVSGWAAHWVYSL